MARRADQFALALNAQRETFRGFLVAQVGSEAAAEDILQNGLVKALQKADSVHDEDRLTPWFYQLLRHAVIDHYRSRASARRRDEALAALMEDLAEDGCPAPPDWEPQICGCLGAVIETLKPRHAELLRRIELDGESVQTAARALKITPNLASVTAHRARAELRKKLEAFCGACAGGGCLDCDCAPRPETRVKV